MAVKPIINENPNKVGVIVNDCMLVAWELAAGDVGAPVKLGGFSDRTVHFSGDFSGSAMSLRGSCLEDPDPEQSDDWFIITDPKLTTPLQNITAAGGYVLYENPLWISPACTGGTATAIKTSILGRKK